MRCLGCFHGSRGVDEGDAGFFKGAIDCRNALMSASVAAWSFSVSCCCFGGGVVGWLRCFL